MHVLQSKLPRSCSSNMDSTPLALDVLGFSQFKHSYARILDNQMGDGTGIMNKTAFLQAIEEPFIKTFTVNNIKESFKLVGLHPLDASVIKTLKTAPSIPTVINGPPLTHHPTPLTLITTACSPPPTKP